MYMTHERQEQPAPSASVNHNDEALVVAALRNDEATLHDAAPLFDGAQHIEAAPHNGEAILHLRDGLHEGGDVHDEVGLRVEAVLHSAARSVYTADAQSGEAVMRIDLCRMQPPVRPEASAD